MLAIQGCEKLGEVALATTRKLPDCDVLRQLVDAGLTKRQIATQYQVTVEAVRQAIQRCSIQTSEPKRMTHARYIPWRLRADHQGHVIAGACASCQDSGRERSSTRQRPGLWVSSSAYSMVRTGGRFSCQSTTTGKIATGSG